MSGQVWGYTVASFAFRSRRAEGFHGDVESDVRGRRKYVGTHNPVREADVGGDSRRDQGDDLPQRLLLTSRGHQEEDGQQRSPGFMRGRSLRNRK